MAKKHKRGRPSLNYRFDKIKPGKRKFIDTHNVESCQQLARQYARKHALLCDTKVVDGRVGVLYTEKIFSS